MFIIIKRESNSTPRELKIFPPNASLEVPYKQSFTNG